MPPEDHVQWRIQDFPQGSAPTPKSAISFQFVPRKLYEMKEFEPGGGHASLASPLRTANDVFSGDSVEIVNLKY